MKKNVSLFLFILISLTGYLPVQAQFVLESLDGPVTQNEINAFKKWAQGINIPSNWAPTSNQMSYGTEGRKCEGLGMMYELTNDKTILDGLIKFADGLLKRRNNPVTGTFEWTGERELIWLPEEVRSGAEQGLIVSKIAYAAQLILQTPSIWNLTVPDGNPNQYGVTYRDRALKYVQEMELTESTYLFKWYVRASDKHLIFPNDPRSDAGTIGGELPYNQKWMMMFGKMRMAKCHELLGNTALATKYREVVQANLSLYSSQMYPRTYQGHDAYIWYYPVNNQIYTEDIGHAQHGIIGMLNLDILGGYISFPDRVKMANAILYANYRASDNAWNHNVAGTNETWYRKIQPGFIFLSRYLPELYTTIGNDLIKEDEVTGEADATAYVLWAKNARHTGNWSGTNTPPTVSITLPANNATFTTPANITINATAGDANGIITKVDFYHGSALIGTDNTSPYSVIWTGATAGIYSLTAKATDDKGTVTTSSAINITVNTGVATVYKNCNYSTTGYAIPLPVGTFTTAQLLALGIANNDISSLQVSSGYEVVLYNDDNFLGTSLVLNVNTSCLSANSFNDLASSVQVRTVSTNTPPTVNLTAPTNNTTFTAPANFTINASASDASPGTISKVDFYRGTTLIGTDNTSPYSFAVSGLAAGTYSLTARATDNLGAVTTSTAISITVNATTGCTAPQYIENGGYVAGSTVKNTGGLFECKPYPYSGWCNGAAWAYGPGTGSYWQDAWIQTGICSARISSNTSTASGTALLTSAPNPFANTTTITVTVEIPGETSVIVYDQMGKEVAVLANGYLNSDTYIFNLDGSNLNAGIYVCRLVTNDTVISSAIAKQ